MRKGADFIDPLPTSFRRFSLNCATATVLTGQGVKQDYIEAAKWFRKAANQGNIAGLFNLGYIYEYGLGVSQGYPVAAKLYRNAAEQGDMFSQSNLGAMYVDGRGVPQDYAQAAKWFRKSADQGNAGAQFNVARMYDMGRGVPEDFVMSYMWLNLAAASGDANAIMSRDMIAEHITPDQIAEAQRLAREWVAAHPKP